MLHIPGPTTDSRSRTGAARLPTHSLRRGSSSSPLTIIKWAFTLAGVAPAPVFSFPFFRRYAFLFALTIALTYSVFCILQEIVLRSGVQHSLMHFLTGRFAKTRIIATTTLITAATHLHMKSLVFPL